MRFIKDELSLILKTILTLNVWNTKNIQIHHLINLIFIIFWWHTSWYFAIPLLCTRFVMCVFTLWIKDTAKDRRASYLRKKHESLPWYWLNNYATIFGGKHFKKVREKISSFMLRTSKEKESLSLFSNAMQLKCCCNINFVYVYVFILYIKQFS